MILVSGPEIPATLSSSPLYGFTTSAAYASWVSQLGKGDIPLGDLFKSLMNCNEFRVWGVNLASFVNDDLQSHSALNLNEDDEFQLKYTMIESENIASIKIEMDTEVHWMSKCSAAKSSIKPPPTGRGLPSQNEEPRPFD